MATKLPATITRFTHKLEAGFRVGRMNILREIEDIKMIQKKKRKKYFVNMLTIAEATVKSSQQNTKYWKK
uniref:hypothetical protein n=1 Tax=Salmonella sp. TaxID=599 RepID=UPI001CD98E04|nr:hypothetical protein [Salmonella sp.]